MAPRPNPLRSLLAAVLVAASTTGSCSVALVRGPPSAGEADHDPTGHYEGGVPCTSGRTWPIVDAAVLLATLIKVANYGPDQRDETLSGLLGAAAFGVSAWIGHQRTSACGDAQATAAAGSRAAPSRW